MVAEQGKHGVGFVWRIIDIVQQAQMVSAGLRKVVKAEHVRLAPDGARNRAGCENGVEDIMVLSVVGIAAVLPAHVVLRDGGPEALSRWAFKDAVIAARLNRTNIVLVVGFRPVEDGTVGMVGARAVIVPAQDIQLSGEVPSGKRQPAIATEIGPR